MNKARITYRLDQTRGKDGGSEKGTKIQEDKVIPLYKEEFQVVEHQVTAEPLNAFTTDFGSWNSPFETESDRVERVIRENAFESDTGSPLGPSTGRQREGPELDPELWSSWVNDQHRTTPELGARVVKSSAMPWFRIVASVAAAVITGVAFGFFVLSMFTSGDLPADSLPVTSQTKQTDNQSSNNTGASQVPADQTKGNQAAGTAAAVSSTPLNIAAKSYTFLQNGVFSSLQSAQSAQTDLKKKGFASALQQGDKTTVFVAFAVNRDDALAISQQLREQKLEVYIKNVDLPAATNIRWNGTKPAALTAYFTQADKLIQMLSGLTIVHLAETKQTPLDDSTLQEIRAAHQAFTTLAASLNEAVDKELRPLIDQMNTALSSSVQSMEEYKKNPSTAMLWQTQSSMMQYILTQKALLTDIRIS